MSDYQITQHINPGIFRAYDIRGIVGEGFEENAVYTIARAIAVKVSELGHEHIVIGRDARISSPQLAKALCQGLLDSGMQVFDIGEVPTPLLYFATHVSSANSGVMLTASHNPAEYNGLKIVVDGQTLSQTGISEIAQVIKAKQFIDGQGDYHLLELTADYLHRICEEIKLQKPLRVVLDCGNGVAGQIAPQLFTRLGCDVIPLFCEVDGNFPNHHPDPSVPENLVDLQQAVLENQADIGLAFDGDADRVGVVTNKGKIIWPDRQLMLIAKDVLSHHQGAPIVFDVKCSHHLPAMIEQQGGEAIMWKTGHSILKQKIHDCHAPVGGEMSGHIFFQDRWYGFDDGMYAAARLLELLATDPRDCEQVFAELPEGVNTPELKIAIDENSKFDFIKQFIEKSEFEGGEKITIDGVRVAYEDGWGLLRTSNTSPNLTCRFEANDQQGLSRIQQQFKQAILSINSDLNIPF